MFCSRSPKELPHPELKCIQTPPSAVKGWETETKTETANASKHVVSKFLSSKEIPPKSIWKCDHARGVKETVGCSSFP